MRSAVADFNWVRAFLEHFPNVSEQANELLSASSKTSSRLHMHTVLRGECFARPTACVRLHSPSVRPSISRSSREQWVKLGILVFRLGFIFERAGRQAGTQSGKRAHDLLPFSFSLLFTVKNIALVSSREPGLLHGAPNNDKPTDG